MACGVVPAAGACCIVVADECEAAEGEGHPGGCAGRFHSVVYTADGVYTCGLNAGQIGQWCCAVFGVTCERDSFGFVKVP